MEGCSGRCPGPIHVVLQPWPELAHPPDGRSAITQPGLAVLGAGPGLCLCRAGTVVAPAGLAALSRRLTGTKPPHHLPAPFSRSFEPKACGVVPWLHEPGDLPANIRLWGAGRALHAAGTRRVLKRPRGTVNRVMWAIISQSTQKGKGPSSGCQEPAPACVLHQTGVTVRGTLGQAWPGLGGCGAGLMPALQ